MPVTLENRQRRMQVFNLPHESFCRAQCACSELALVVIGENPRTGERAPKHVVKQIPSSLTLLSRERRRGLPVAVLEVPEVKAAIRARAVRVLEHTADLPHAPPLAPAAAAPTTHNAAPASNSAPAAPMPSTMPPPPPTGPTPSTPPPTVPSAAATPATPASAAAVKEA
jgi:hypothetical protein